MRILHVNKFLYRRGGAEALSKYRQRFGGDWVETRPKSDSDETQVRLKPLSEFRALVEHRGRFIMIPGEEISDRAEGVPVHMNASTMPSSGAIAKTSRSLPRSFTAW